VVRTDCDDFVRDLDAFPNPARYFDFQHVSLTRGCPADCTFCGSPDFWGRKVRFHSADYFVDELTHLYRKGITYFFFCDDTFTLNKKKVIAVCRKILEKKLNIVWQAISRMDLVNEELLYWMRRAGCIQISYGVESGSEKIRRYLKKDFTRQQIEMAFSLTTRYGIMSRAYFIYGCPGETPDTIQETIDLMCRIKPLSTIFYILDIFPGTALYSEYKSKHNVSDDIWLKRIEDILYFETDPQLTREKILAFGKKLRTAFYENLPFFVQALELVDNHELYALHADFLSRLAMTFDHGDYSKIAAIRGKGQLAVDLYQKALAYHPDPRAYLGLGIHRQKAGQYAASIKILAEGLGHFPRNHQLNMCLGVSYMNVGEYEKALACFVPLQHDKQALRFMAGCYQAMNHHKKAETILSKIRSE
jgi:anaerobic magnesium-protoporphyrin IX monomethyl ester cyclase